MKKYSVDTNSVIFPSIPAPAKTLYGVSIYEYGIKPEIITVY